MNSLDVYNIINKVKSSLPKKYHRPYEILFDVDEMYARVLHEYPFAIGHRGVIGLARPSVRDITICIPNLISGYIRCNGQLINGQSGYIIPAKTKEEAVAYVYLHESGHLASDKYISEDIADKFATYWFNKIWR